MKRMKEIANRNSVSSELISIEEHSNEMNLTELQFVDLRKKKFRNLWENLNLNWLIFEMLKNDWTPSTKTAAATVALCSNQEWNAAELFTFFCRTISSVSTDATTLSSSLLLLRLTMQFDVIFCIPIFPLAISVFVHLIRFLLLSPFPSLSLVTFKMCWACKWLRKTSEKWTKQHELNQRKLSKSTRLLSTYIFCVVFRFNFRLFGVCARATFRYLFPSRPYFISFFRFFLNVGQKLNATDIFLTPNANCCVIINSFFSFAAYFCRSSHLGGVFIATPVAIIISLFAFVVEWRTSRTKDDIKATNSLRANAKWWMDPQLSLRFWIRCRWQFN